MENLYDQLMGARTERDELKAVLEERDAQLAQTLEHYRRERRRAKRNRTRGVAEGLIIGGVIAGLVILAYSR